MSAPVNDLIKEVRRKEVRNQGKESQARSAFTVTQYLWVMEQFEDIDDDAKVSIHTVAHCIVYIFLWCHFIRIINTHL